MIDEAGQRGAGLRTLAVDCGGTGIKACVLDPAGAMVSERLRVPTPYPCPPERLVETVVGLAGGLPAADRASVGLPGLVRHGVVHATPHFVTEAGPFTPRRVDLVQAWDGFDVQGALAVALGMPVRAVNDAEVQGLAVVSGRGYEVVLTLGTGLGFAQFDEGRLLPKLELSQLPFRKKETYDQQLGNHARKALGDERWSRRVLRAVGALQPFLWWDHLYLGGGNARHLSDTAVGELVRAGVVVVPNIAGLLGGVRLWELADHAGAYPARPRGTGGGPG
ncbi:MAG TPA: ROK family protein [Motilibacteraceae bacterium]|nr:ROK family protein [Motilibacteraceae bacterium]